MRAHAAASGLLLLVVLAVASTPAAQGTKSSAPDPEHETVEFENDQVRVI